MRTVRSAAWARNRPRRRLAWLIVLVLIALAVLIARVDAAPGDDALRRATQYADAITGADVLAAAAPDSADPASATRRLSRAQEPGGDAADDLDDDRDDAADDPDDDRDDDPDQGTDGDDEAAGDPDPLAAAGADPDAAVVSSDDALTSFGDDPDAASGEGTDPSVAPSLTTSRDAGALAALDASAAASEPAAVFADASAGASEAYELAMRRASPSPWGRVDVGLALRRRWTEPMHASPSHTTELWLVAIWRQ